MLDHIMCKERPLTSSLSDWMPFISFFLPNRSGLGLAVLC